MNQTSIPLAVSFALRATLLFGAGTPFVKLLVGDLRVLALAGKENDQGLIVARALTTADGSIRCVRSRSSCGSLALLASRDAQDRYWPIVLGDHRQLRETQLRCTDSSVSVPPTPVTIGPHWK